MFLDNTDRAKAKKNIEDALARYPDLVLTMASGLQRPDAGRSRP